MSNLGISKEQAAGIAGNFAHESSGFVPGIREGGPYGKNSKPWPKGTIGRGYGWAQWTNSVPGDRYDKFIESYGGNYNKIPTNEDNLKFAIQEMKTTNKLSAGFKKMTNVAAAAVWFRKNWERAGVHHDGPRISYAKGILGKMDKGGKLGMDSFQPNINPNPKIDTPHIASQPNIKSPTVAATPHSRVRGASLSSTSSQVNRIEEVKTQQSTVTFLPIPINTSGNTAQAPSPGVQVIPARLPVTYGF
jgi:hypothetical protein